MKRYLFLTGATAVIIHFALILFFCFPQYSNYSHLLNISKRYVFPVFNQNWQMFAPEPPMGSRNLYYRCRFDNNNYSPWIDPGKSLLEKHQANRFWNYGKLFNIYESIHRELKYLDTNTDYGMKKDHTKPDSTQAERSRRIIKTPQYKMAFKYFSTQASAYFTDKKIKRIEFIYVASTFPPIENKTAKKKYELITFPTIDLEDNNN
ncbi:MAG: hypothetical protein HYU69_00630 [Bacteroidetes bacterium]|nr:hypothetical protein [Bacteroidota bacterium]